MFAWGLAGSLLVLGGLAHFVREGTMLSASFGALIPAVNVYFAWQERRKFKS